MLCLTTCCVDCFVCVTQFIEEEASVAESSPAPPEVTDDADDLVSVFYTHDHHQVY